MSKISVTDLSFSYEGNPEPVFEGVTFRVDTDWKLGVVGRNGRGKTTLLRLLTGEYTCQGAIDAGVRMAYFPYSVSEPEQLTMYVMQEICPEGELWQFKREFFRLDLDEDVLYRPYEVLSQGEQTKVLLAALFLREGDFLLIDEPTNHLDQEGREKVSRYLASQRGFMLVSHDRAFLDGCTDHILAIERRGIRVQKGNFSSWYENKKKQELFEQGENEKLKKEIGRLQDAARTTGNWGDQVEATKIGRESGDQEKNIGNRAYIGEKSRRMQQRRKNLERRRQKALEEKQGLLKNQEKEEPLKLFPLVYPKRELASFQGVSLYYGEKCACQNVTFDLKPGDRLRLQGKNGSGKSSILKRLLGEKIAEVGEIRIGSGIKTSYVPQNTGFLTGKVEDYIQNLDMEETLFKAVLRKLDFPREQFGRPMEEYSEGQKKKVLIAASLCTPAHLYVWDEPLNYLDLYARIQIEELLKKVPSTMIFIEHDRSFGESIATKTIVLS